MVAYTLALIGLWLARGADFSGHLANSLTVGARNSDDFLLGAANLHFNASWHQLTLSVGYSHDVVLKIPAGVDVKVSGAKQELLNVSGIDKQAVGEMAAVIRASRKPEPYQGKGVRYKGEYIFRKEGKKK